VAKNDFEFTGFPSDSPTVNIDKLVPRGSSLFDFKIWIVRLRFFMSLGFRARASYNDEVTMAACMGVDLPIDEETLDGKIQYSTFFDVMKSFAGKDLRVTL
ncbi:hypothetical protein BDZ89DRAFT_1137814, partial [Hymenopellis radicata]